MRQNHNRARKNRRLSSAFSRQWQRRFSERTARGARNLPHPQRADPGASATGGPAAGGEAWHNNRIGISKRPPPPFLPVSVRVRGNGAEIRCWGRVYTLGATGLPVQIESRNAELLAAPITLTASANGAVLEWTPVNLRLRSKSAVQVILEGRAVSAIGILDWTCTAEYDGLLRYDLEITPAPKIETDRLELTVPVHSEHAQLKWQPDVWPAHRHGRVPAKQGILVSSGADWYTWLGDCDRGLAVFFETHEAWDNPSRADAFQLERRADAVRVNWRFVEGAKRLPSPWRHTFGIEATPVKSTPGGRQWFLASHLPVGNGNFAIPWATPKTLKYFGYPQATDPENLRRLADWYHNQDIQVTPYVLLNLLSAAAPEFATHPEWTGRLIETGTGGAGDVARYGHDLRAPSPTPDYIDWIVWKCDQFVRANDLDGLYHDFTMLMVLTDIEQGFGYVRDGKPVRCYPFFQRRELYKRIYTMLKQYKKDAINIGHMSGNLYLPYLAFCDIIVTGEHFGGSHFRGKTYQELLPDDYIQAEIMGHNYGLTTIFLEQWSNLGVEENVPFLLGLALLYDFSLWRADSGTMHQRAYNACAEFGAMDAEFLPFWHTTELVKGQTETLKCSAYRRRRGGAVLVIFNRDPEARELTLRVDWRRLTGRRRAVSVRDVLPAGWDDLVDNHLPAQGPDLTITVPGESFRLLTVE